MMSPTQRAESYLGILQGLEISDSDREFLDKLFQAAPETLNKTGRRIASVALAMERSYGMNSVDTADRIRAMITQGILFKHATNATVSFFAFKAKRKRTGRCVYCGKNSRDITKDHVRPRGQGGPDSSSNIVLACKPCNLAKGNRTPQQWAAEILRYNKPQRIRPIAFSDRLRVAAVLIGTFVAQWIGGAK